MFGLQEMTASINSVHYTPNQPFWPRYREPKGKYGALIAANACNLLNGSHLVMVSRSLM